MSMPQAINIHDQSIELVERFAQCILSDCKDKNDLALAKQLGLYILHFSQEIELNKKREKIFENFVKMIDSASEKPNCEAMVKQFTEEIDKATNKIQSNEKFEKYLNFMDMISHHYARDEDYDGNAEIKTISETVSTIDPVSKLPIVDPVKNKICGHTYDKTTILQLIEQNPRTRCPIAGCSASDFVKKTDLVPDNALKRLLSSTNSNAQKKLKVSQ